MFIPDMADKDTPQSAQVKYVQGVSVLSVFASPGTGAYNARAIPATGHEARVMSNHRLCILGGTGFVGQHLAARLNQLNIPCRILTRRRERHRQLLVLPKCEVVEADVYDDGALREAFEGFDTVVNLVGILNERGHNGEGFRKTHVELARKILQAAQHSGVNRLLQMSALNADAAGGTSFYLRTKGDAEDYLHTFHGSIKVTSFRPAVIFGPGDSFFNRFARLLRLSPGIFPLPCPQARFAPVYVGDVVDQLIDALDNSATYGRRIDLCGPEEYTLRELIEYLAGVIGVKRLIVNLPDFVSLMQAVFMEFFVPGKPFSLDNYRSLQRDAVCCDGLSLPTGIEAVVPGYLGRTGHNDRYRRYRQSARRPANLDNR